MGTTQRIVPGVPGEPNWGDLNKAVTNIAKTVEKEQELDNEDEQAQQNNPHEYERVYNRRNNHIKSVFRNLVRTAGGARNISRGRSSSLGRAGLKSAGKIAYFFSGVRSQGLENALRDIGFDLAGKSFEQVLDFLLVYCSESSVGMDETAANMASCELLNTLAEQSGNDLEAFEALVNQLMDSNQLANTLCDFWGLYIFEHLSQRFEEKITQQRGEAVSAETFRIIKEDILGQVRVLNEARPIEAINWRGAEGQAAIESIFYSIINIISDENDN